MIIQPRNLRGPSFHTPEGAGEQYLLPTGVWGGGSYESISTRRHLIWRLREPGDAMQDSRRFLNAELQPFVQECPARNPLDFSICCTYNNMKLEFNAAKDKANRARHGVSLIEAARLDWDRACVVFDDRIAYGEDRFIATGTVHGRVYVVVFTMRGEVMRVISMRAANRQEFQRYEAQIVKNHH
jgi:uncharacterized DUF497 family protein